MTQGCDLQQPTHAVQTREEGPCSADTRVDVVVERTNEPRDLSESGELGTSEMGGSSGRALAVGSGHDRRLGHVDDLLEHGSVADRQAEKRGLGPFSVTAIGLGAMRLAGPNVFGPPANRDDAIALLRSAVESGVDHIDTAQYYGPDVVNELIREALHPYPPGLVLVSKVGARRGRRGEIFADDKPDRLRQGIEDNLRTLGTEQIGVVNLRLMRGSEPDPFFDDQLAAMMKARDDGVIRAVGLSNVSLPHLLHALKFTEIACVQNAFHPADRTSQPVLDECTRRGIVRAPCWRIRRLLESRRVRVARRRKRVWPGSSPWHQICSLFPARRLLNISTRTWTPYKSVLTITPFKRSHNYDGPPIRY